MIIVLTRKVLLYFIALFPFPLLFQPTPSFIFHSFLVRTHSQCRQWVGSISRSLCPSLVQLSFSHVYIRVQLATVSGQSGVLRRWPMQRNVAAFSSLNYFITQGTSHIVVKSFIGLSIFSFWPCSKSSLLALLLITLVIFFITANGYHQLQACSFDDMQ